MGEVDDIIAEISPYYKRKKEKNKDDFASLSHNLIYDSSSEALEPLYFWILDFMGRIGLDTEKLVDNFASSPGSGHFSELGAKKSQMQEQASRILATVNTILRSVLNLIYDLKEFNIRLSHYDAIKSNDKNVKEAANLALKQIWMDKVDFTQRGQGSINALSSGNLQFVTLRDAFFVANSIEEADKIDLNDRVKRILKARVQEFFEWRKRSELELRKRYEIEKAYLKSQVDALKLQARWAKPYLRSAEKLVQNERLEGNAALVTAFNTILLQLTLLGKKSIDVESAATKSPLEAASLPEEFKRIAKKLREYYSVVVVDLNFIGIPSKVGQHYAFGGKADIKFKAYGLHEQELDLLHEKLNESDLNDALKLVENMTDNSLGQLKIDLEELFEEDKKEEKKKEDDINPFTALFNLGKKEKKDEKEEQKKKIEKLKKEGVRKDSYPEAFVRNLAIAGAMNTTFLVYDILKKSYGMASVRYGGDKGTVRDVGRAPEVPGERLFGLSKL